MRGWLIGAALLLAGCVEDNLTRCGDGTECPAGRVCDTAHHGCAAPDQVTTCAGLDDGTSCHTAELDGRCFDGVCLVPGCGNRVVEPGEQCDDGNHVSGDGCSADCRSDERCGNGVADGTLGEACDDGNLASHDGCNSRCQLEAPQWTIDPAMLYQVPRTSAFDAAHGMLVAIGGRVTWLWDGAAWHTPSALVPAVDSWVSAAYDAGRMRVVAIGKRGGAYVVAEWDGTQWTEVAQTGTPPGNEIVATVYEPARHAILWIDSSFFGYLDAGAWTTVDTAPFVSNSPVHAAFDEQHGTVVVSDASATQTFVFDGAAWTSVTATPTTGGAHSLVYDGDRHQVLSIGGIDAGGTARGDAVAWTGSAWTDTGARVSPRGSAVTWWDGARHVVGVAGGTNASATPLADVLELAGTTVTPRPIVQPTAAGPLAYDLVRDAIIESDLASGTYAWNSGWQKISPTHVSNAAVLVYDPVRTAMLAYDSGSVLQLDTGWRMLASATSTPAITYDFERRGVVSVPGGGTFLLPSVGSSTLTSIAAASPQAVLAAAYDPDTHDIVGLTSTQLLELAGAQWTASAFAPTGSYAVVSGLQTSSILFVPTAPPNAQVWERRAGAFREIGELPFTGVIAGAVERGRGRLAIEVTEGIGTVFLERQLTSDLPDETCAPDEDADGDGAAGCADPDCWQTCGPACPLATSCP